MRKSTQLIDEIANEARNIRQLTDELRERYRTMGALLISAKALVPSHRWNSWLEANFDWNAESVETVMEADFNESSVPNLPVLLEGNGCLQVEEKPTNQEGSARPNTESNQRKPGRPKTNRMK